MLESWTLYLKEMQIQQTKNGREFDALHSKYM
jgi:hypothetical protein